MEKFIEAGKMVDDGKILGVQEMREFFPEPHWVSLGFAFQDKDEADVFLFPDAEPDCYICNPVENKPCVHILAAGIWKARNIPVDESKIRLREEKQKAEKKARVRKEWEEIV
jgi:hypothetical protein